MAKPNLPDVQTLIAAGINPKTGLPIKAGKGNGCTLKEDIRRAIRLIDEQDAVNRYVWYNLPCNLSSQELERMLYYKGQLCFFYMPELDEFYFMPYALDGTIDFYGRYNTIHPVPMTSGQNAAGKAQAELLSRVKLNCVYGIKDPEELTIETLENSAVLLYDYSRQMGENIIPRQQINDPIVDLEAECLPLMRTRLLLGTGVKGIRVNDADQQMSVYDASRSLINAALTGEGYMPIIGNVEFQELTDNSAGKAEEYTMAMQSLDNFRLSTYGLDNGGLFNKKAHVLAAEEEVNQNNVGLVLNDGLSLRQNFCNIVNSIWGIGIWCEPSQNETGLDVDGDGKIYDSNESESTGVDNGGNSDESNL